MKITITRDRVDIDFSNMTGSATWHQNDRLALMDKAVELSRIMGPENDKIVLTPRELDMASIRVGYNPNVISSNVSINGDAGDSGSLS